MGFCTLHCSSSFIFDQSYLLSVKQKLSNTSMIELDRDLELTHFFLIDDFFRAYLDISFRAF